MNGCVWENGLGEIIHNTRPLSPQRCERPGSTNKNGGGHHHHSSQRRRKDHRRNLGKFFSYFLFLFLLTKLNYNRISTIQQRTMAKTHDRGVGDTGLGPGSMNKNGGGHHHHSSQRRRKDHRRKLGKFFFYFLFLFLLTKLNYNRDFDDDNSERRRKTTIEGWGIRGWGPGVRPRDIDDVSWAVGKFFFFFLFLFY
jgi:hypothetical protein